MKWPEKENKEVLGSIGKTRMLLNNMLHRKAIWSGHNLRRNCLLHDATEGTDDGSERNRKKENRKEEAEDKKR